MPNLYSPPTVQPQAQEKNPPPEFATPELKTTSVHTALITDGDAALLASARP